MTDSYKVKEGQKEQNDSNEKLWQMKAVGKTLEFIGLVGTLSCSNPTGVAFSIGLIVIGLAIDCLATYEEYQTHKKHKEAHG